MVESTEHSIAVITHDAEKGGSVGSVAWNHINLLAERFHVYVISQGVPETENRRIHPVLVKSKKWNGLGRLCHVPNELSFLNAAKQKLVQLCDRVYLKAVWCHSHGLVTLVASPIARKRGFLVIMTTHGDIFERPAGTYDLFLTQYYKLVTKKAYSNADRVHVLSPYMSDLADRNGARKGRIRIIPNGVYPKEIGLEKVLCRQQSMFTSRKDLRVLFVGNLLPIKGLRYLIRALVVAQARSSTNIYLQCVGSGPEMPSLVSLSRDLGLEKQISFTGNVAKKSLSDFYKSADVLCVPSDSDSLPTVVLEAFSAGLPVVGAATGGISYMVSKERGFLFKPGNVDELSKALANLAANKSQLIKLSRECSAVAKDEFCWDTIGNRLVAMLSECIVEQNRTENQYCL